MAEWLHSRLRIATVPFALRSLLFPFLDVGTNTDATTDAKLVKSIALNQGFGEEVDLGNILTPGLAFTSEELASELDRYLYSGLGCLFGEFELVIDLPTPGDIDLDGDIDSQDATILYRNWTGALPAGGTKRYPDGDIDLDGDVDTADATLLIQYFVVGSRNATIVPEANCSFFFCRMYRIRALATRKPITLQTGLVNLTLFDPVPFRLL